MIVLDLSKFSEAKTKVQISCTVAAQLISTPLVLYKTGFLITYLYLMINIVFISIFHHQNCFSGYSLKFIHCMNVNENL